jgi:DNA-binding XRE family transcriptional regulator
MLNINPKLITIDGAEMVLLTRDEFEAMMEIVEDAEDAEIYRQRKADLEAGYDVILPVEVSARCRKGESLLRAIRNWRGLTQAEVADKAGLTQGYLSDLESGKREGAPATLRKIAEAMGVDPRMLVDARE